MLLLDNISKIYWRVKQIPIYNLIFIKLSKTNHLCRQNLNLLANLQNVLELFVRLRSIFLTRVMNE